MELHFQKQRRKRFGDASKQPETAPCSKISIQRHLASTLHETHVFFFFFCKHSFMVLPRTSAIAAASMRTTSTWNYRYTISLMRNAQLVDLPRMPWREASSLPTRRPARAVAKRATVGGDGTTASLAGQGTAVGRRDRNSGRVANAMHAACFIFLLVGETGRLCGALSVGARLYAAIPHKRRRFREGRCHAVARQNLARLR